MNRGIHTGAYGKPGAVHSAVFAPASCSRKTPMICSSVNFDLFMSGPLHGPDSSIRWTSYRGSQQTLSFYTGHITMTDSAGCEANHNLALFWRKQINILNA